MEYFLYFVVVVVLAFALQPKPAPAVLPPSLDDIEIPTVGQGKPVPKVFGKRIVTSPNIVWYGDLGYNDIRKKGGK